MATEIEIAGLVRELKGKMGRYVKVGTAESATAGRVADRLTDVPGSSNYFIGSVVAYSNETKIALLGVLERTLAEHGAVSDQTAREMAQGVRRLLGVDICVSDTGIAGPTGDGDEKHVGLFYLALAAQDVCLSQRFVFTEDREGNKREAAEAVLRLLRDYLRELVEGR